MERLRIHRASGSEQKHSTAISSGLAHLNPPHRSRPVAKTEPYESASSGFNFAKIALRNPGELDLADLLPFHNLQVLPIVRRDVLTLTPRDGASEDEVDLDPRPQPDAGGAVPAASSGPAQPAATPDSCDIPRSMGKVTSGSFLNGLTANDYYPDLASRGYPANAGPFDLGNRAGSSVQLNGVVPSPCDPSQFSVGQTASVTRLRINGVKDPLEGTTFDDHARSGRDTAHAPFRQQFLGGGAAPLGLIISFCDVPSVPYGPATTSAEFDANFVAFLAGPAGRQSVNWSISVRIASGSVTSNTVS